jgi:hypothetical protein
MSGIVDRDTERKRLMSHFKCVTCMTRHIAAGEGPGSCEGCGSALEPVADLTEVVGYRAVWQKRDTGRESFEGAVAAALRGMETTAPRRHGDRRAR